MKKSYLLKSVFICCFMVLGRWIIDNFLISEAKILVDDRYNCQGCICGSPYHWDECTHWDESICCSMLQALEDDQLKNNFGNYVIDDNLKDLDLVGDPISFSFEIQCVDAAGNKIDESNCNPTTKPTSCDVPEVNPTDKYYTVEFNCNGWSNPPENQTFTVGSSQALHANTCTRTNYKFLWWSRTEWWAKDYDDKQSVNPWGTAWLTVVLYAVWEYSPQTYTIEFSKRWESDVMWTMPNLECKVWESCKLTKNQYSKNNYDFVWWSVWSTSTETPDYLDEASVLDIASGWETKTLYPIWKLKEESWTSCTNLPSCNNYHMLDFGQLKGDYCYQTQPVTLWSCVYDCYQTGCQESDKVCYNDINDIPRGVSYTSMIWYCAEKTWKKYWVLENMNSCNWQASCQFGTSNYISLRWVWQPILQWSANISCSNENEKCCYYDYWSSRHTMKCVKF